MVNSHELEKYTVE